MEGQGEDEGLASAEEVRCTAVKVDDYDVAFLFLEEATIATVTMLLSTAALGVSLLLGVGTTMIIPGLLSLRQRPRQRR